MVRSMEYHNIGDIIKHGKFRYLISEPVEDPSHIKPVCSGCGFFRLGGPRGRSARCRKPDDMESCIDTDRPDGLHVVFVPFIDMHGN